VRRSRMKPVRIASALALVALSLVVGVTNASATEPAWSVRESPNPAETTGNVVRDITCPVNGLGSWGNWTCISVGNSTTASGSKPLIEIGEFYYWYVFPELPSAAAYPGAVLEGISCTSETFCLAVGYYAPKAGTRQPLAERWNGEKWVLEKPAVSGTNEFTELLGISCTGTTNCKAVGSTKATGSATSSQTLIERWNGSGWSAEKSASPFAENRLVDVSCVSSTACMAVGKSTVSGSVTLAETYNGTEWKTTASAGGLGGLEGVSCTAANACTAVGEISGKIAARRWNGTSWLTQVISSPAGASLSTGSDVHCISATSCTAVGSYTSEGASHALAERWNGTTWTLDSVPPPAGSSASTLLGVFCLSSTVCESVGDATISGILSTLVERYS
jgi:hypothetical protein